MKNQSVKARTWAVMALVMAAMCGRMPVSVSAQSATTEPAEGVDLSTPNAAMASLVRALAAGDRDAAYRCMAVDPKRAPTELDGLMAWNIAQNHLMAAGVEAFGKDAAVFRSPAATFDGIAQALRTARGEPAKAVLNEKGDEATFMVEVPAEVIEKATTEQAANLKAWIGHKMRCKKIGSEWKFDLDRSMRVEMDVTDAPEGTKEEVHARNVAVLMGLAQVKMNVAADIRAGKFASTFEVQAAIKNGDRLVVLAAHGRGLTIHVFPADVKE